MANAKKTTRKKPAKKTTAKKASTKTTVSKKVAKEPVQEAQTMSEDKKVGLLVLALLLAAAAAIVWYADNESKKLDDTYSDILETTQNQEVPVASPVEADSEDASN